MSKWIKLTFPFNGHLEFDEIVELWDWLDSTSNFIGRVKYGVYSEFNKHSEVYRWFKFKRAEDVMAFKLRWC